MDQTIIESLAGFDAVWQRVTGHDRDSLPAGGERPCSEEETLLALIHGETCAAATASALARMLPRDGRGLLARHAAEAKRRLRRLRAEYYILTGRPAASGGECRPASGRLSGLREEYLAAGRLAERYDQAAAQTRSELLGEVFTAFAADVRRRERELRALLIDSF